MFGIGMPELLMILAVALIIIGPKKLPELAKTLGRALGEFKRATNDLKESIHMETGLDDVGDQFKHAGRDIEDAAALTDEAASTVGTPADQSDATDQSMSRVGKAFDELNSSADTESGAKAPADRGDSAQDNETS
jgi:Tat protein translocase TatB subunit